MLVRKLHTYGIRGIAHNWFENYLRNRKQFVSIHNVNSKHRYISYGFAQGSVLGRLLFLLNINDIIYVSSILFSIIFADDMNNCITGKNEDMLICTLNDELIKLVEWLDINKLSLNVTKTQNVVLCRPRREFSRSSYVQYNGNVIQRVTTTRKLFSSTSEMERTYSTYKSKTIKRTRNLA